MKIIAEIGNNHEGDLETALQLIDAAKKAGSTHVKLQTFKVEKYVNPQNTDRSNLLSKFALTEDEYHEISKYCHKLKIGFLSTPFDADSAEFLSGLTNIVKISSGDNNNYDLIKFCLKKFDHLIISTGLCSVDDFVDQLKKNFRVQDLKRISVLFCVALYPHDEVMSGIKEINKLAAYKDVFEDIGYSDHTKSAVCAVIAKAFGANIFEKHITLSNTFSDFRDHQVALEPHDFEAYIEALQKAENALRSDFNFVLRAQRETEDAFRRSPIYNRDMAAGEVLQMSDVEFVRPRAGLDEITFAKLLGKKTNQSVKKDEYVNIEHFTK